MVNKLTEELDEQIKIAKDNPHYICRFHPTDWWHEIGCPHIKWKSEQLQDALEGKRAMVRVLQHKLYGTPLDGNPRIVPTEQTQQNTTGVTVSPVRQAEPLVRQLPKEEFVRRCCEMMEIDNATTLTYHGIVDLLENIYEQYFERQSA